jgi:hypothetical protein
MNTQTISTSDVKTVINTIPKGSIFTVDFVKKDGSLRVMNCRTGVKSHLTPNPKREKPAMPSNMVTVFDMQKGQYRHINVDTTRSIKACGINFIVK